MKCEPSAYTIDDLARDGVTGWEGVRNYQARNFMRDEMKPGDGVLFYASNADPSGVVGLAEIARAGYPDPFAFKKGHRYHDEKSNPEQPTWYTVDLRFSEKFPDVVSLDELRQEPSLANMMVLQKGSRLSIQPVTRAQFEAVVTLGRAKGGPSRSRLLARAVLGELRCGCRRRRGLMLAMANSHDHTISLGNEVEARLRLPRPRREPPGRDEIEAALLRTNHSMSRTWVELGLSSRDVLYRLIKKYGISTQGRR